MSASEIYADKGMPDCDICAECGEHTGFDDDGRSECCGAGAVDTDPDLDLER